MNLLRVLLASLLLTLAGWTNASYQAHGVPYTYAKVSFLFSSDVYPLYYCNEVLVDLTGLQVYPISDMVYGNIICPSLGGQYGAFGYGYVVGNLFHMNLAFGNGWNLICNNLPAATLSGPCIVTDSSGVTRGSAYIVFL